MLIDLDEINPHAEPCLSCGEETAMGSVFYSDRLEAELKDGTRGYLCSECARRIRSAGQRQGPTDAELAQQAQIAAGISMFRH